MPMLQDTRLERGTSLVGIYADVTDKREKKKKGWSVLDNHITYLAQHLDQIGRPTVCL